MSASATFVIAAVFCGYHLCKDICLNPEDEKELTCEPEVRNLHDPLAVGVKKLIDGSNTIIGHVPSRPAPIMPA